MSSRQGSTQRCVSSARARRGCAASLPHPKKRMKSAKVASRLSGCELQASPSLSVLVGEYSYPKVALGPTAAPTTGKVSPHRSQLELWDSRSRDLTAGTTLCACWSWSTSQGRGTRPQQLRSKRYPAYPATTRLGLVVGKGGQLFQGPQLPRSRGELLEPLASRLEAGVDALLKESYLLKRVLSPDPRLDSFY